MINDVMHFAGICVCLMTNIKLVTVGDCENERSLNMIETESEVKAAGSEDESGAWEKGGSGVKGSLQGLNEPLVE